MISGEVLDALLAAGATAEMIVAAVKADAAIEEARRQERRQGDAERQRRSRSNRKSCDVTVTPRDKCDTPPKEIPPTPPKEITPPISPISSDEDMPPQPENPVLKPDEVVEAWNVLADRHGLPKVRRLTDERKRKLATRLRATTFDDWTEAIQAIDRNPWLRGENDRGWRADFDFILQPKSFTKLIEGSYDKA